MKLKKLIMELGYRYARMPYESGPPEHLMELMESGRISPCRAIDLGCGTGGNAVFLAQHGFEMTGVDFDPSAIAKARRRAEAAGVRVAFIVDDLTNLEKVKGTFDFLTDFGALDTFGPKGRDLYVRTVLPLTHPGSRYLPACWEWSWSWWERLLQMPLEPGEVERRFGEYFEIEKILSETNPRHWPPAYLMGKHKAPGFAVYLMTRKVREVFRKS
jgi:SAM-dependent methyltransferase